MVEVQNQTFAADVKMPLSSLPKMGDIIQERKIVQGQEQLPFSHITYNTQLYQPLTEYLILSEGIIHCAITGSNFVTYSAWDLRTQQRVGIAIDYSTLRIGSMYRDYLLLASLNESADLEESPESS